MIEGMPEAFSGDASRELAREREAEIQDLETRIERLTVERISFNASRELDAGVRWTAWLGMGRRDTRQNGWRASVVYGRPLLGKLGFRNRVGASLVRYCRISGLYAAVIGRGPVWCS